MYKNNKVPNYSSVFGFSNGGKQFLRIEKPVSYDSGYGMAIKAKGVDETINLRSTISDHSACWIYLVAEQYNVSRCPDVYKKMFHEGQQLLITDLSIY